MLKQNISLSYRLTNQQDLSNVLDLLQLLQLPTEGVEKQFKNFLVALTPSLKLIGVAGIEEYGQFGLLRSIGIHPSFQGTMVGSTLVQKIEELAKSKKIKELYLLTETAEGFFAKHSYTTVDRMIVPQEIQQSYEYSISCKQTAVVMFKAL